MGEKSGKPLSEPPPLVLPETIRALLEKHGPKVVSRAGRLLADAPRQCIYVGSRRVNPYPQRRSWLGRLAGLKISTPTLPLLASKFGGTPYVMQGDPHWDDFSFVGQINLADVPWRPEGVPNTGLLSIDISISRRFDSSRVRWYPDPLETDAVAADTIPCLAKYECALNFKEGWSLPGIKGWDDLIPESDDELWGDDALWDAWDDWEPQGYREDEDNKYHRLFGHLTSGVEEKFGDGFAQLPSLADPIEEYQSLLRLCLDIPAGFSWNTNWIYVLIHKDDLAKGDLDRAIVTNANG